MRGRGAAIKRLLMYAAMISPQFHEDDEANITTDTFPSRGRARDGFAGEFRDGAPRRARRFKVGPGRASPPLLPALQCRCISPSRKLVTSRADIDDAPPGGYLSIPLGSLGHEWVIFALYI